MKIIDDIVKSIAKEEIAPLQADEFDQVRLDPRTFDAPPLDDFLNPDPDAIDEDDPEAHAPTAPPTTVLILGRYYPMSSPGTIVLYQHNLKLFYRSLIREVLKTVPSLSKSDLEAALRLVVLKTYYHEGFHFDCNLLRKLFGSQNDRLSEEALAVAWSRMRIARDRDQWNTSIGRMNALVYNLIVRLAYRYRSPGYSDWPHYSDEVRFKAGLRDYINPPNAVFLEASGVPVCDVLFEMLGKRKDNEGYIERAV